MHKKNPLDGITLALMLETLVDDIGFTHLGDRIAINCFLDNPSIKSSLTFLRRTPRARKKVEKLYVEKYID